MPQNILTIDMITRKALEIFENSLVITRNVNRQYDSSFAETGAKIGSQLRIRLPDRALVTDGAALQVQDDEEQFTTLQVSNQKHIGVNFTTAEMALSLDDFADRVLKPRISQLAASVDADVANVYRDIYNSVGTPGTAPATSLVLLQAQQKLSEGACPLTPRYATVNPAANAGLVEGMKGFFNPTDVISRQFKTGLMGENVLGYEEVSMSQSIKTHTTGAWGTGITVTNAVTTQGQTTLDISFTGSARTWRKGDVFTIANVNMVNPQLRETVGALQQFTVTADVTGTSTATLQVSPPMYTASEALATIDAFPLSGAAVTMFGAASTAYPQNLVYHKDAITFATADLVMPKGVDTAARAQHNGISMRIVRQYDINNDRMPCRIDVLYGYALLRGLGATRMWG
jgi:hypothetical protein